MNSHIGRDRTQNSATGLRAKLRTGLAAGMLALFAGHLHAAPGVLSQSPLFLVSPVQPNIFFLLDDSGSMTREFLRWDLVEPSGRDVQNELDFTPGDEGGRALLCNKFNTMAYDPGTEYTPWAGVDRYGNPFTDIDPTNAPVNPYTGTGGGCDSSGQVNNTNGGSCNLISGFDGNGARYYSWTDGDGNGTYDYGECDGTVVYVKDMTAAERINYANWFSYYRKREYVMKRAMSQIIQEATQRMGFGTINRNNHVTKNTEVGTPVKDVDDLSIPINPTAQANKATMLDNLLGVTTGSSTPLRLGLEHVGQYFQGDDSTGLFGGSSQIADDPDSALKFSPILKESLGGACQQNFAIVMSDGFWNGRNDEAPMGLAGNADANGAGPFDGQSYADGVSNTLADIAMHFYETDLIDNTVLGNRVPIVDIDAAPGMEYARGDADECSDAAIKNDPAAHPNCYDTNTAQHLVTYTVALGLRGTLPDVDDASTKTPKEACVPYSRSTSLATQDWPDRCTTAANDLGNAWPTPVRNDSTTIDDMFHAAWNGRGMFLSARNPQQLINSLRQIIQNIESKQAVAAAAVAVDSASILAGGNVVQGKFDSDGWVGQLNSYAVTVNSDGKAVVASTPSWSAHDLLDTRGYSTRIAVTYNGTKGIPFAFPANYKSLGADDISQQQVDDLLFNAPYPATTVDATEIGENKLYGEKLVAYLLGDAAEENSQFRDRTQHKLGDIIHSAPVYVGDPDPTRYYDSSYQIWAGNSPSGSPAGAKGRREMIYVGANDGALHAFYADTGEEAFAYFPQAVFNNETQWGLHFLADPGYIHRYYVDGDITVAEIYADTDGTGDKWHTILVGTLRGGGRAIYAIDVSDPSEFATASGVASNILWEFSDTELGFTYGKATIAKLNNGRWAAVFGNGYIQGATATGEAALFAVYFDNVSPTDGPDFDVISTGSGSNAANDCLNSGSACNGLSTPAVVDLGGDNIADRAYAGDLLGNLWAFDLSSAIPTSWNTAYGASPLFTAKSATAAAQQITTQPAVILHPTERHSNTSPNTMVYFGTGQYVTETDPVSTTANSFYGIWDAGSAITSARDSALVEQTITQTDLAGEEIRIMTNNPVDYSTARGWFVDLPDEGERVVANAIAFGDVVVYNTIVPKPDQTDLCAASQGNSWLMVHSLIDGSEPDFIALDVTGEGNFDESDQKDGKNVTGIKSGSLNWQITITKSGPGAEGVAFIPAEDLDTRGIRGGRSVGTRSSWGRFIIE